MEISPRIEENVCIVTIEGKVLHGGNDEMITLLSPYVHNKEIKGVIIDLSHVHFIDSSGVSLIALIFQQLQNRQAGFALVEVRHSVSSVINILQLDKYIPIHETVEEALALMFN